MWKINQRCPECHQCLKCCHAMVTFWADSWQRNQTIDLHDDVIKWKLFPRYWPFVRGIHRSPVNSPHNGQWRCALMLSLICAWTDSWLNNRDAGGLRPSRSLWHHCNALLPCRILTSAWHLAVTRITLVTFTNLLYALGVRVTVHFVFARIRSCK